MMREEDFQDEAASSPDDGPSTEPELFMHQIVVGVSIKRPPIARGDDDDFDDDDISELLTPELRVKLVAFVEKLRQHLAICGFLCLSADDVKEDSIASGNGWCDENILVGVSISRDEYKNSSVLDDMGGTIETLASLLTESGRQTVAGFKTEVLCLYDNDDDSPSLPVSEVMRLARESGGQLAPEQDESESQWLSRIRISDRTMLKLYDRWEKSGFMLEAFASMGPRRRKSMVESRYLAAGLVRFGEITLWAGMSGVGKSLALLDLASIVGGRAHSDTWLGRPVTPRAGNIAVFAFGEDSHEEIGDRLDLLDPSDSAGSLWPIQGTAQKIDGLMEKLDKLNNVDLLVVDPARKFLFGDEDSSTAVDEFLSRLEDFCHRTGTAVIVSHHLKKGLSPTKLSQIRDGVRGSSLWVDRARVAVGMYRAGNVTNIGIFKSNMAPTLEMMAETSFHFDKSSGRLLLPAADVGAVGTAGDAAQDAVLSAFRCLKAEGSPVQKHGANSLYEYRLSELQGLSRVSVRAAIARLITLGVIVETPDGLALAVAD